MSTKRIYTMKNLMMLLCSMFILTTTMSAQSLEELKAMQADKKAAATALMAEADGLQKQINEFPGWKFGGLGIVGLDISDNNGWYALPQAYSKQNSIGLGFTAFGNYDAPKLFWRNGLTLNVKNQKSKNFADDTEVEAITDALLINSLGGYKLTSKWALSAEAAYNSTLFNFNDPGQLTISAGATWLPIKDLVVVIHPLGYQFNFPSGDFTSSPGAKIGATYTSEIFPGVSWNSSLNAFIAYSGGDVTRTIGGVEVAQEYSTGDLTNWTWLNGFGFNIWKGIGVGLNVGLRGDRQLVDNYAALSANDNGATYLDPDLKLGDNPIQFFYNLGLSYGF